MPSPYRHPKTGVYWIRQRVPADLTKRAKGERVAVEVAGETSWHLIGAELKLSLRTKTVPEAKARAVLVTNQFNEIWGAFRSPVGRLTQKEVVALAGEVYRDTIGRHEDDPGDAAGWAMLHEIVTRPVGSGLRIGEPAQAPTVADCEPPTIVREELARRLLVVDDDSERRLAVELRKVTEAALLRLGQVALGDYSPDEYVKRFPVVEWANTRQPERQDQADTVTLTHLVENWAGRNRKPKPQTEKRYRGVIRDFVAYLGHDEATRVTDADVVRWHDELLASKKVSHETFVKTYQAAIGTAFTYAMSPQGGKLVSANPVAGLLLEGPKREINRSKYFTAEETRSILRATLRALEAENDYAAFNRSAQRWVPWICAYTGARPGEVCQLRKQDFVEVDGIKCMALLPDAGTIKTGEFRNVPLHPHLLEQGLWEFVQAAAVGPLFYNGKLKSESPWVQTVQMLGEWVRGTAGVKDPRVRPNHAWRHWFKTKGRTADIPPEYLDVICGHAPANQGGKYGGFEEVALLREIKKLPKILV